MAVAARRHDARSQRLQTIAEVEATAIWCTPTYALRLLEVAVERAARGGARLRRAGALHRRARRLAARRALADRGGLRRPLHRSRRAHRGRARSAIRAPRATACTWTRTSSPARSSTEDLRPAAPGERGELVLTPLRRTGFPVLRYRTGDVVVNSEDQLPRRARRTAGCPGGIVGPHRRHGRDPRDERIPLGDRGGGAQRRRRPESSASPSTPSAAAWTRSSSRWSSRRAADARSLQETMRQQLGLRVRVVPVLAGAAAPRARARPAASSTTGSPGGHGRERQATPPVDRAERPRPIRGASEQVAVADPALHPGARASAPATSSGARRTSPPSSASAARPCARRSSCSRAAT